MITSDYDSAKMHIETAIETAKKYNMNDMLSRLYLIYGRYFHEIGLVKSTEQKNYLKGAEKMYELATNAVRQTMNNNIHAEIEKAKQVLKAFKEVNGIEM